MKGTSQVKPTMEWLRNMTRFWFPGSEEGPIPKDKPDDEAEVKYWQKVAENRMGKWLDGRENKSISEADVILWNIKDDSGDSIEFVLSDESKNEFMRVWGWAYTHSLLFVLIFKSIPILDKNMSEIEAAVTTMKNGARRDTSKS